MKVVVSLCYKLSKPLNKHIYKRVGYNINKNNKYSYVYTCTLIHLT